MRGVPPADQGGGAGLPPLPAQSRRTNRKDQRVSGSGPDEFMTVAEVAAILKLNQQTVRIGDWEVPLPDLP